MKKYQCHKIVEAGKIIANKEYPVGGQLSEIAMSLDGGDKVTVDWQWWNKYKPQVGGYFVKYEDGYTSYSPAEAFEGGYTELSDVDSKDAPISYVPTVQQRDMIGSTFTYYAPKGDQVYRYNEIRESFKSLALILAVHCPPSRELSMALSHLQEGMMCSNAAIACNE